MYGIPVSAVLQLEEFRNATVLAGHSGLNRIVTGVNVMEVPDVHLWVRKGELLLTAGFAIRDSLQAQMDLIPMLAEKGLAGLVFKPYRYIDQMPKSVLDIADNLGFPILEFPQDMSHADLITAVLQALLNYQSLILTKEGEIHSRLAGILLAGGKDSLNRMILALAEIVGNPVELLDNNGDVWVTTLPEDDEQRDTRYSTTIQVPITGSGDLLGYFKLYLTETPLTPDEKNLLNNAAGLVAVQILGEERMQNILGSQGSELLYELLVAGSQDSEYLLHRGANLNWELSKERAVFLITPDRGGLKEGPVLSFASIDKVQKFLTKIEKRPVTGFFSNRLVIMVPMDYIHSRDAKKSIDQKLISLGEELAQTLGQKALIGIGRPYENLEQFSQSYKEALKAVNVLLRLHSEERILYYDHMGVYKILSNLTSEDEQVIQEILQPLIDYDIRKEGNLLKSLMVYFDCHENLKLTSEKLFIHYNTLVYRLGNIERLLGISLNNTEEKLNLAVALKLHMLSAGANWQQ